MEEVLQSQVKLLEEITNMKVEDAKKKYLCNVLKNK